MLLQFWLKVSYKPGLLFYYILGWFYYKSCCYYISRWFLIQIRLILHYKSGWYSFATPSCMAVLGKWLPSTGIDVRAFVELFEAVFELNVNSAPSLSVCHCRVNSSCLGRRLWGIRGTWPSHLPKGDVGLSNPVVEQTLHRCTLLKVYFPVRWSR